MGVAVGPVSGIHDATFAACLVLDFDGTILDTEEPLYRSWAELWDDHGHQLSLTDWQQNIGTVDSFDPWAQLEHRLGRPLDPGVADRRRRRRDDLQSHNGTRPGVRSWLAEADRLGVPVGIASSSPIDWVEEHLERLGLREQFGCVVCVDHRIPAKPEPTSYLEACRHLASDPSRSVAVEDSPNGVAAAVGAGLFTVAVPNRLTVGLDLSAADVVADSLDQLTLLETLGSASLRLER